MSTEAFPTLYVESPGSGYDAFDAPIHYTEADEEEILAQHVPEGVILREFDVPRKGGVNMHVVVLSTEDRVTQGMVLGSTFTCGTRTFRIRGVAMPNPRPENEMWLAVHEET